MNKDARRRFALAAITIGSYAACADTPPAEPQHTPFSDGPKLNVPRSIEKASDYDVRIRLRARATRSQPMRSNVRPATTDEDGDTRTVTSTAYCLTGHMANGQPTYAGAVAMNDVPLGSQWEVEGTGHVYTVADRIGHGSQFDIAMPGDCAAARAYGRRTITIRRVT